MAETPSSSVAWPTRYPSVTRKEAIRGRSASSSMSTVCSSTAVLPASSVAVSVKLPRRPSVNVAGTDQKGSPGVGESSPSSPELVV